jgi:hypothetical protein
LSGIVLVSVFATALASCKEEAEVAEPQPRPVRTATVEKSGGGVPVVVTGRMIERSVGKG